jgi:hypothetical protein
MAMALLEQFIAEECTAHVRTLITNAIADSTSPGFHFEFNRFELTARRDNRLVTIEDVLDATAAGARVRRIVIESALEERGLLTIIPGGSC